MNDESKRPPLAHASGTPVTDNLNIQTAGPRGPVLLQDVWLLEKLAHFAREVIPERRMHAKGSGAHGTFTVTHDITRYTKAKIFSKISKQTPMFARFSAHWDHRIDDDHWQQPGDLFRKMTAAQQQTLFDNTARQVGGAAKHIQERHIGNYAKADPAYGAGVAKALGSISNRR
jgi:catalase